MSAVSRPAIITTKLGVVTKALDVALAAVVAILAEALQWAQPKGIPIAVVANDVIDFGCGYGQALAVAASAPRLDAQLMQAPLLPAGVIVPNFPMRMTI